MSETFYDTFTKILEEELEPALGCTEPIAIAYCASMMRSTLGEMPEHIDIRTSGNIIKNVKAVTVPNSGGMKGIEVAAILGVLGGRADLVLEVLSCITKEQIDEAKVLMAAGFASVELATGVPSLYIEIAGRTACHECTCIVSGEHTNITYLEKDGKVMVDRKASCTAASSEHRTDRSGMSVSRIIDYAKNVPVEDIALTIDRQIEYNTAIAREGLSRKYGVSVGRTLLTHYDASDVRIRARAMAAAGSDARMSGCSLPVIINSGSGNQGLTVSLPVIEYAKEYHKSHEELVRALALSNLIAIHQKRYIGPLSAFCGAVNAATGAAAGICFLLGGSADEISQTITDVLANVGGIVCDGAKPSCAAKISSALEAAILSYEMTKEGNCFKDGEGLVGKDIEQTIESFGRVGREGMKETDVEILKIMLDK